MAMTEARATSQLALLLVLVSLPLFGASKECKYPAPPHVSINILNQSGNVTVKTSSARQAVITATPASSDVEVDCNQAGARIEAFSHPLQNGNGKNMRVDYDLQVPPDANVFVRNTDGPIKIDGLSSDVSLRSNASEITASNLKNAHLHVVTVNGPVSLTNVTGAVDVLSSGGNVQMQNVSGAKVAVSTTNGNITYSGDPSGGGVYSFINHTGNIDVSLPASASVDVNARTIRGRLENDFPLQQNTHLANALAQGRSFRGTSNSGSSSLELSSFSGTIRVRKQ